MKRIVVGVRLRICVGGVRFVMNGPGSAAPPKTVSSRLGWLKYLKITPAHCKLQRLTNYRIGMQRYIFIG